MATILDRQSVETYPAVEPAGPAQFERAPAVPVVSGDGIADEPERGYGIDAPWLRVILIGVLTGFLIALPVLPNADRVLTAFGEFAVAYGLPCHAPPTAGR